MKVLSRPVFLIIALLFSFIPFYFLSAANPLDVVINEIAWMGTEVKGIESKNWWRYEWLELYNNTGQTLSLEGWKIELYRDGLDWFLELKGNVLTKDYFLIVASDKIFSNYDLNYSNLGGKFNNSGQKVVLKDALGNVVDETNCFSSGKWFAGDNATKQTMERISPAISGNDSSNWQTSQNPGGTPKAKNSLVGQPESPEKISPPEEEITSTELEQEMKESAETRSLQNYPSGIVINEILPSPEGPDAEEEWIEIFNQNEFEVDLSNWQLTDTEGKTTTCTFPQGTKISPQGFLVLSRTTTKITLNNESDGLNLIQPDGKVIDSVSYEKASRGQSYNRTESGWVWSSTLTPGSTNVSPVSQVVQPESEKEKPEDQLQKAKEPQAKKGLAAIGEQIPKTSKSLYIFLIALAVAIFSGIIILILKMKLKEGRSI